MLVNSIFSFSHLVFHPFKDELQCWRQSYPPPPPFRANALNLNQPRILYFVLTFNILPHDIILDWSKLKILADKINVTEKMLFVLGRVRNIAEKKKMLVTSIFSFSDNVFESFLYQGR